MISSPAFQSQPLATKARPSLVFLTNAISSGVEFIKRAARARVSSARLYHWPVRYASCVASRVYLSNAAAARAEIGATAAWLRKVHSLRMGNSVAASNVAGSGGMDWLIKIPQFADLRLNDKSQMTNDK